MTKKYRLKKKYESPLGIVHVGVVYTNKEWQIRWFPHLKYEDFDIKDDWFELVEPERIEVNVTGLGCAGGACNIKIMPQNPAWAIPESQFPAIKEAIEQVLNSTTHICKHCNAEVNTPDDDCYKAPPKEKDTLSRDWEAVNREAKLWVVADIISRIFYYGGFKIETVNERTLAGLLNELGLFPTTEEKIMMRPSYENYFERFKDYKIQTPTIK